MNRKVLVTLLWKEIRDLEQITEGFLIMTEYPEEIVQLVVEKTESIQSYILQLGQFKSELSDFYSTNTNSVEQETELLHTSDGNSNSIVESEIEQEPIETGKIPAFIVTSNQEVSIDDHFVELEDEDYLDEVEVLETIEEMNSETPIEAEPIAPEVLTRLDEIVPEIINIEPSKVEIIEDSITPSLAPTEALVEDAEVLQTELFDELKNEPTAPIIASKVEEITIDKTQNEITPIEEKIVEEIVPIIKPEIINPEVKNHQKITDIKQSISLGDRFRFQRDLFKSNGEDMNKTIKYLNQLSTLNEALSFLEKKYQWDADDESAVDFYQIVKRRFL